MTVVVPVRDERSAVPRLLDELLRQDYPGLTCICFVDDGSVDGSLQMLRAATTRDSRVRVLEGAGRGQASALNLAFSRASTDIVMRLDAHASYGPDVVRCSVSTLSATGAAGVGALARVEPGPGAMAQAIALAHVSAFGVGVAAFRREGRGGWADTAWNGCYWRHVIDEIGPFREDLPRAEDNEFHARIRAAGYGIYLSPHIDALYRPRRRLAAAVAQQWANGGAVVPTVSANRSAVSVRHLVPGVCVVAASGALLVAPLWPPVLVPVRWLTAVYGCLASGVCVRSWLRGHRRAAPLLLVVLPSLHAGYGLGTIVGAVRLARDALLSPGGRRGRLVPWSRHDGGRR